MTNLWQTGLGFALIITEDCVGFFVVFFFFAALGMRHLGLFISLACF